MSDPISDIVSNKTVAAVTKFENFTNKITFFIFDNKIVKDYIGINHFCNIILIILCIGSIQIGSYASIEKPKNALPPTDNHPLFDPSDKDYEKPMDEEKINTSLVMVLPVLACISLTGMYFFTKNYNKEDLSAFLNKYIIIASFSSVSFTVSFLVSRINSYICSHTGKNPLTYNKRYRLNISNNSDNIQPLGVEKELIYLPESTEREKIIKEETLKEVRSPVNVDDQLFNFYISTSMIYGYILSLLFCISFVFLKGEQNWILNNILGVSSIVYGLSQLKLPSFRTGTLLLTLFFFYDIYFVFGTEVMVTVATKIDIPAKILVPKNLLFDEETQKTIIRCSLIGLGDLAIPGAFISLALRFDLFLHHEKNPNTEFHILQSFKTVYFNSAIIGYLSGLLATLKIVEIYEVGQPALLYLCPGVFISVFSTALWNGDFRKMWDYDEMINIGDNETDKEAKKEEFEIICSKETLFLSGEILDEDDDEEDDLDFILTSIDELENDEEEEESYLDG